MNRAETIGRERANEQRKREGKCAAERAKDKTSPKTMREEELGQGHSRRKRMIKDYKRRDEKIHRENEQKDKKKAGKEDERRIERGEGSKGAATDTGRLLSRGEHYDVFMCVVLSSWCVKTHIHTSETAVFVVLGGTKGFK